MGDPRMESLEFNVWQVEQTEDHAKMHVELYTDDGYFIVEVFTTCEPGDEHSLIKRAFTDESEARSYFDYLEFKVNKFFNSLVGE